MVVVRPNIYGRVAEFLRMQRLDYRMCAQLEAGMVETRNHPIVSGAKALSDGGSIKIAI